MPNSAGNIGNCIFICIGISYSKKFLGVQTALPIQRRYVVIIPIVLPHVIDHVIRFIDVITAAQNKKYLWLLCWKLNASDDAHPH